MKFSISLSLSFNIWHPRWYVHATYIDKSKIYFSFFPYIGLYWSYASIYKTTVKAIYSCLNKRLNITFITLHSSVVSYHSSVPYMQQHSLLQQAFTLSPQSHKQLLTALLFVKVITWLGSPQSPYSLLRKSQILGCTKYYQRMTTNGFVKHIIGKMLRSKLRQNLKISIIGLHVKVLELQIIPK